jgi:hypothetical protein
VIPARSDPNARVDERRQASDLVVRRFDEGEWQENIAEPRTEQWLWFVVANILCPIGYQADFGISEDGEPMTG